ncbi:MAG: TolC family protein [Chitinophagales bacterium]
MPNKKYTFLLITFLQTIGFLYGQTIGIDSLLQSIQKANPALKMYDADIRSMEEAAKGARSWMPPEFGAGFWMTPYQSQYRKADDMGQPGMGSFMISAQQMFPNKRKQDADAKYMEAMSSVEREKKGVTLNELYALAKKNYYQWVILEKKLRVIEQDEQLLNFMIENAEIRFKNGLEKISAYYKAKAALGTLMNMKVMLQNEKIQKRILLNTLMNTDKMREFAIDTTYFIKDFSTDLFDSTSLANARSDIKAIDRDIQLTYLQQDAERTKLKPEFGVRYDHMFAWAKQPWQFSLMGMVKIPFASWSSKMYKANIESLKWKAESLEQQKQMVINEAKGMAYGMYEEMETKKKQVRIFQSHIIPALRKNYQTMLLGYEQNTEEMFMLFDAWETLNMTQLEYLDQLQQLLQLQVELERLLEKK